MFAALKSYVAPGYQGPVKIELLKGAGLRSSELDLWAKPYEKDNDSFQFVTFSISLSVT